ncbi:MAG: DUF3306 domain-containing protein [Rhodobacteraceae bacterium]|nr:DUF3306 domain-containing protein [Paracoccaceae bacterium]
MSVVQTGGDFWSRRRAAVAAEAAADRAAEDATIAAEAQQALEAEQAEKTDAELLEELGLKDPDLMVKGDDFSAFMRAAVPERLRRRALRVLWRSNPVLANLDGLLDHDDDFTDAATVTPRLKTAYQVGKGMFHHVQALAAEAERIAGEGGVEPAAFPADDGAEESGDAQAVMALADEPMRSDPVATSQEPEDMATAMPRRHMRFRFSQTECGDA